MSDPGARSEQWEFEEEHPFLEKLEELVRDGTPPAALEVLTPVPVPAVESILRQPPSLLRFFTLAGGLTGAVCGFAFTIFTVKDWPLITGGKPLISIPPFVIIVFALTILFGALASFAGFLLLARLPPLTGIQAPVEHDNRFVIRRAAREGVGDA